MVGNYYKRGSYNAICDVCGFKFKSYQLRKRWDNLMVCEKDFELRHPMDFLKAPKENLAVPWTRPEQTDQFIELNPFEQFVNWVNTFNEGIPSWEQMIDS